MSLSKDLICLTLQFLHEEDHKETAHMLEIESGCFFDMEYFEDLLRIGNWDEAENYLSGFTELEDNRFSTKIFFEIRKQKYLEALDKKDSAKAIKILNNDLKVFRTDNEELFKDLAFLLTLDNIRQHEQLTMYGDTKTARKIMINELKKIIEANPLIQDKLQFPNIENHRLRRLVNQSLNWQHLHCENPLQDPCITTLFVDHKCQIGSHLYPQSSEIYLPEESIMKDGVSHSNSFTSSQDMPAPFPAYTWTTPRGFVVTCTPASSLGYLGNPDAKAQDPLNAGGFHLVNGVWNTSASKHSALEGLEDFGNVDEELLATPYPGKSHSLETNVLHDFPKTVARILNEGSSPTSMDFHPFQHTVLLVGSSIGDIGLWEVISGNKLLSRNFKVWDIGACSRIFKVAFIKDSVVSVNRIRWSPDGSLFGIAYSKHIVQLYSYHGGNEVRQQLEIDAHVGGVNDLAFATPYTYKSLLIITCGDDKTVKAWDVVSGSTMYTFEGHEAPVYSVCPHAKGNIHFIFSTSIDGKIKAWLYDNFGARVDYDSPGRCCTRMAYSANDVRLFSCGTIKDGESFLTEWNETEGSVKRTYQGLSRVSSSAIQFDTTNNHLLAAGDEHKIKIWDMDNVELLTTIDADGCLAANPVLHFNKEGTLLAVVANENRVKILATNDGLKLLQNSECRSTNVSTALSETMRTLAINGNSTVAGAEVLSESLSSNGETTRLEEFKYNLTQVSDSKPKVVELFKYNQPSQCRSMKLTSPVANKISKLIYNNGGDAILALMSNGLHLVWKWPKNELNSSGRVTTKVPPPQLWHPTVNFMLMTNDLPCANLKKAVPCFALSKNDSYLISASGGNICLFNMLTFERMKTVMPPPPVATCIAFHPQDNNIIAIGMDDSTITIYNVCADEVISILKGHSKRIKSLAFSSVFNVLVSSGADNQICVWSSDVWVKQKSTSLKIPVGVPGTPDTFVCGVQLFHIQFNRNHTHFLTAHDTHLAIYETTKLECERKWVNVPFCSPISHATFSCDSQLVYASFQDGNVYVITASDLKLQFCITPTAYLPAEISSNFHPVVIAAHPKNPFQFSLGLSDGSVYVLEPQELTGKWPIINNGTASSMDAPSSFASSSSNQTQMEPLG